MEADATAYAPHRVFATVGKTVYVEPGGASITTSRGASAAVWR
jgi:hypothetical protein